MSKEQNFNADLIAGLSPVIELPEVGKVFRDTTNRIAEKVAEAGKILDITLNDSIIIGDGKYISLREKKILI